MADDSSLTPCKAQLSQSRSVSSASDTDVSQESDTFKDDIDITDLHTQILSYDGTNDPQPHVQPDVTPIGATHTSEEAQAGVVGSEENLGGQTDASNLDLPFRNIVEAKEYLASLRPIDPEMIANDTTIPHTDEEQQRCVRTLERAFHNVENVQDKDGVLRRFTARNYDRKLVILRCYELLDKCMEASESSKALCRAYGSNLVGGEGRFETFKERFEAVVEALTSRKYFALQLYDPPFLVQFADNPLQKMANAKENQQKWAIRAESQKEIKKAKEELTKRKNEEIIQTLEAKRRRIEDEGEADNNCVQTQSSLTQPKSIPALPSSHLDQQSQTSVTAPAQVENQDSSTTSPWTISPSGRLYYGNVALPQSHGNQPAGNVEQDGGEIPWEE